MNARRLILAVQFLTRLPTPRLADAGPGELGRSAVYFPLVGAVIGVFVAATVWCFGHVTPWVGALAGVVAWVWITGGLHLDGLGDVADGLGASHAAPERFLEVLRDPHAGNFAVVAIALQIAAKLVLLAALPGRDAVWALILVPAWARWGTLAWSRMAPPLREGLGARFASGIDGRITAVWGVALAAASLWAAPPLIAALAIVAGLGLYWRWRLGGITGDGLGANVEVTESLLLLALVAGAV